MTKREEVATLLYQLSVESDSLHVARTKCARIAELLIQEEPEPMEAGKRRVRELIEMRGHWCTDGLRKPVCAPWCPKPEPERDWLDSQEFANVFYGWPRDTPAMVRMRDAIRANYVSPREKRYREALVHITASYYCTGETLAEIARQALDDSK